MWNRGVDSFRGVRFGIVLCLIVGLIVGTAQGAFASESPVSKEPTTWGEVLGSPRIGKNQEVLLIYKPIGALSEIYEWEDTIGQNGSIVWSHGPNEPPLDLSGLDIQIIEEYPAYIAALGSVQTVDDISRRGYHVEVIERATTIGRGAFAKDLRKGVTNLPPDFQLEWQGMHMKYPFLLKLLAPPRTVWIEELERLGAEVLDSAGFWTYLVKMEADSIPEISSLHYVAWLEPYHYGYRMSKDIESLLSTQELSVGDRVSVVLVEMPDEVGCSLLDDVREVGGDVQFAYDGGSGCVMSADTEVDVLHNILHLENLMWAELHSNRYKVGNDLAVGIVQSGQVGVTPVYDAGIDGFNDALGAAELVAMADSGIDIFHDAFDDSPIPVGNSHRKIQAYYPVGTQGDGIDNTGHGTHVAGTIAGDDTPVGTYSGYDGHAFLARLIVQDINDDGTNNMYPPDDYYDMYNPAANAGARIHTNSWGSLPNDYDTASSLRTDQFMFEVNKDFLVLFLAGNDGSSTGTIWQTGNAKNILTVGATRNGNNANNMATFSSRGPAEDGRLKPTVVAPGQDICSALATGETSHGDCHIVDADYHERDGTSMATPAVAASAALVREYFLEGWYPTGTLVAANGFEPSAALVKAMIIASAEEISGSGTHSHQYNGMDFPNVDQGWGRVNLDNALYFRENGDVSRLMVIDERGGFEQSGDWYEYSFHVGSPSEPVKVALVWTDAPGNVGCDSRIPCIRNDLNLEVIDPRGVVYRGNVFQGMNPGQSVMGGNFDDLNVEEVFLRYSPFMGRWRVRVIADTIDVSPQPFALVVTGDITHELPARLGAADPVPGSQLNPSIATDSQGNTHIAWVQTHGGLDTEIWYARYDENSVRHWKQLTDAWDDADGDEQFGPVIAVSPVDGAIYVIFANRNEASPQILQYYLDGYKSTDGGNNWNPLNSLPGAVYYSFSLSGPREINDRADPIDLYIDASGQLHLIWTMLESHSGNEYEAVKYAQSGDGITWPSQYQETLYSEGYSFLGPHYNKLRYPKVAKGRIDGPNNYVHAIYSYDTVPDSPGGSYVGPSYVRHIRSLDYGDNWPGPITDLGTTSAIGRYNDLAADETGPGVAAVWHEWDQEFDVLHRSSLNDGAPASWQYSGTVAGGVGNQRYPAIQMDSSGFTHLTYTTDRIGGQSTDEEIYFLSSIDGGVTWHEGSRVTFLDGRSSYPAIALNRRDTFEVAWFDDREGSYQIYYATLPLTTRVTYQSEHSFNPSVAVDSTGATHMVWVEYRDGDWDIYYARFDGDGVRDSADQQLTTPLDDADGDEQFGPVIAVSPLDNAIYVIFANRNEASPQILSYYLDGYKSTDGGNNWNALNSLPGYLYYSFSLSGPREINDRADPIDLYIDASGQLHLIWAMLESHDGNEYEAVKYAQSGDGITWPSQYQETLYSEGYFFSGDHYNKLRYPKVAKGRIDGPNNYVHAIYSYDTIPDPPGGPWQGMSYVRHIRSWDYGDNWNPSSYIPIGTTGAIGRYNDLAADETGPGVAAVWHGIGILFDVFYARSWDDGFSWVDTGTVAGGSGNQRWPAAALDGDGHLHISYSDANTGTDEIHHRTLLYLSALAPATWSDARQLTRPWGGDTSAKYRSAVATSPTGTLHVAWDDAWGSSTDWMEIYLLRVF